MHSWTTWAVAAAMLLPTAFFVYVTYRVQVTGLVLRKADGSPKSSIRFALWAAFCACVAALLMAEALAKR